MTFLWCRHCKNKMCLKRLHKFLKLHFKKKIWNSVLLTNLQLAAVRSNYIIYWLSSNKFLCQVTNFFMRFILLNSCSTVISGKLCDSTTETKQNRNNQPRLLKTPNKINVLLRQNYLLVYILLSLFPGRKRKWLDDQDIPYGKGSSEDLSLKCILFCLNSPALYIHFVKL